MGSSYIPYVYGDMAEQRRLKALSKKDPEAYIERVRSMINRRSPYDYTAIRFFETYLASGTNDIFPDELLEKYFPMRCPKNGAFFAYKKARPISNHNDIFIRLNNSSLIVTLLIPKDAKRSSGLWNKCRASEAEVTGIEFAYPEDHEGEEPPTRAASKYCPTYYIPVIYEIGKPVVPDFFDDNRWNECSGGIHFFMTKEEALNY